MESGKDNSFSMIGKRISIGLICLWLLGGCIAAAEDPEPGPLPPADSGETLSVLPTLAQPAATLAVAAAQATFTPIPTTLPTPDLPPTHTPRPTPSRAPSPTAVLVDRSCPDPPPLKPDYRRFVLGETFWPTPAPELDERPWLEKPLPGGGRYLINQQFPYGYDANGAYLLHNGADTAAPLGTPVLAVGDGTVVVAQGDQAELYGWRCDWYGQLVVVELDRRWLGQPIYALYGHVLNLLVTAGERVVAGQPLAEVGFGGAATVPHLHFEIRVGANRFDSTRNPMLWIQPPETRGIIAGRVVDPDGRPWQGVWLMAVPLRDAETQFVTWTYLDDPQHLINPDGQLAENFVLSDLPPGEYRVYLEIQETTYSADVAVVGGEISTVEIVTAPFRKPSEGEEAP